LTKTKNYLTPSKYIIIDCLILSIRRCIVIISFMRNYIYLKRKHRNVKSSIMNNIFAHNIVYDIRIIENKLDTEMIYVYVLIHDNIFCRTSLTSRFKLSTLYYSKCCVYK